MPSTFFATAFAQNVPERPALEITLSEPSWVFEVRNTPLEAREANLDPSENELASVLRPLLEGEDYRAAADILEAEAAQGRSFSAALNYILGQVYMSLEEFDNAESTFLAALQAMPDFARVHQLLGLINMQGRDYAGAREHLSRAIALGLADAQTYGQLAFANQEAHSPWSAINGYQQALLLDPGNRQWRQGLLYALIGARNFAAAQALVDEMLAAEPDNRALWLQSSNIALSDERPLEALTRLEIALKMGESDPDNQVVAAQLHLQHGSKARAVELLLDSIEDNSPYFDVFEESVAWLIYRQQWELSEKLVGSGMDGWNDLSMARRSRLYAHRGAIALARERNEDAADFLMRAIENDPVNGGALMSLAELEAQRGRAIQAGLYYTRAAALEGFEERGLLGHAQLAIDHRDYEQALTLLREAYRLNPARDDLYRNIQALERITLNSD